SGEILMIVNVRLDVNDEQRRALSLLLHPKAPKRLATRQEFVDHCVGHITLLTKGQDDVITPTPTSVPAIEDQMPEVPVVTSEKPLTGFRKMVHHVNCAMFSMANARRMAPSGDARH
ncbi:MAG: hypothetical protein ACYS7Y_36725, partial [Planctomycetota bacterium]